MFRHPALGLGGRQLHKESSYSTTDSVRFHKASRCVDERGAVGKTYEGRSAGYKVVKRERGQRRVCRQALTSTFASVEHTKYAIENTCVETSSYSQTSS